MTLRVALGKVDLPEGQRMEVLQMFDAAAFGSGSPPEEE
jgi:hypothetical protein